MNTIGTPYLTATTYGEANTYAGMAHFSGSGPRGKSCRACAFYDLERGVSGNILLSRCSKFVDLTGKAGQRFPHEAMACKYFQQADPVPPLFEDPKRSA